MSKIDIQHNLHQVNERIRKACEHAGRKPESVQLVAVSKTKPVTLIEEAVRCGLHHFGENRVQELTEKMPHCDPQIQWHMIGTLQTNKIKYMADRVNWIQSVAKKKALSEIEQRATAADRVINTLIQVNISNEEQKSGCDPGELAGLLEYAQSLSHVRVRGLMGMAAFADDPEQVRPEFALLRSVRDNHRHLENGPVSLEHLSMGMTHDMEVAIEEGATMIRVGSALFGPR